MLPTMPCERRRSMVYSTSSSSSRIASLDSWEVVAMISSLCINALLWPQLRGAQAHIETRRVQTVVTNCHGNSCARRSNWGNFPMSSTLRRSATGKLNNLAIRTEFIQTHHGFSARKKLQQPTPALHYSTRNSSIHIPPTADTDDQSHGG